MCYYVMVFFFMVIFYSDIFFLVLLRRETNQMVEKIYREPSLKSKTKNFSQTLFAWLSRKLG